jgi:hypothetical protein
MNRKSPNLPCRAAAQFNNSPKPTASVPAGFELGYYFYGSFGFGALPPLAAAWLNR